MDNKFIIVLVFLPLIIFKVMIKKKKKLFFNKNNMFHELEEYLLNPDQNILTHNMMNSISTYVKTVYMIFTYELEDEKTELIRQIIQILNFSVNKFLKYINNNETDIFQLILIILYNFIYKLKIYPNIKRVRIGNSTIHGKGVFADKNLKRSEVLTLYPDHIVLKNGDYNYYVNRNSRECLEYDDYFFKTEHFIIAGMKEICHNPSYLGHMINDSSNSGDEDTYEREIDEKRNCAFYGILCPDNSLGFLFVLAVKNISKDEELFVPYGYDYWKSRSR